MRSNEDSIARAAFYIPLIEPSDLPEGAFGKRQFSHNLSNAFSLRTIEFTTQLHKRHNLFCAREFQRGALNSMRPHDGADQFTQFFLVFLCQRFRAEVLSPRFLHSKGDLSQTKVIKILRVEFRDPHELEDRCGNLLTVQKTSEPGADGM